MGWKVLTGGQSQDMKRITGLYTRPAFTPVNPRMMTRSRDVVYEKNCSYCFPAVFPSKYILFCFTASESGL